MRPGLGAVQEAWTTHPSTRSVGMFRAVSPAGSIERSGSGSRSARNHHGTPFIIGMTTVFGPISGATEADAAASAGPFTATMTMSCGPSLAESSSAAIAIWCSPLASEYSSPCVLSAASVWPRATALIRCPA